MDLVDKQMNHMRQIYNLKGGTKKTNISKVYMIAAQMLIFGGPTGVGKGTIKGKLNLNKHGYKDSVSWTTRDPRPGEQNGVHYHFKSKAEFHAHWKNGGFLETNANGIETWQGDESKLPKWYGTPVPEPGQKSFYEVDSDGIDNLVKAGSKANQTMKIVIILPPGNNPTEQVESSKQRIISRANKNLGICISECPEDNIEVCKSKCTEERDFLIGADLQDRVNAAGIEITKLNNLYNRLSSQGINIEKFHNDDLDETTASVQSFIDAGVTMGGKRKRRRRKSFKKRKTKKRRKKRTKRRKKRKKRTKKKSKSNKK
jgi:guanylate kinase